MKRQFVVTVDMPEGVTLKQMKDYIDDAVSTMKGSYSPDDPLFDLRSESVRVRPLGPAQAALNAAAVSLRMAAEQVLLEMSAGVDGKEYDPTANVSRSTFTALQRIVAKAKS